ncbi:hypothetical protein LUX57_11080 [Actinomadura madurae]|uniref:hypothetical protein n=1 Tax=Actinomadura madurae TaxID=1993 RepID=UPI0020D20B9C|nr:hypothetical protein [Actinomadura madurae]MCP9965605.1 hypothetical protein [Actinomadura madurae]
MARLSSLSAGGRSRRWSARSAAFSHVAQNSDTTPFTTPGDRTTVYSRTPPSGGPARIATRRSTMIVSCGSGAVQIRTRTPPRASSSRCRSDSSSASAAGV